MITPYTVAVGVILLACLAWYYKTDFEYYSIFCLGFSRRVDRARVDGDHECMVCGAEVEEAERVRWYREFVFFGAPLYTILDGEHFYGESHASAEFILGDVPDASESPVWWELLSIVFEPPPEVTADSEFDNVTKTAGAAFELIPVMLIIMMAVLVIESVERLGGGK